MQLHSLASQNVRRNGLSIVTGFLVLKDFVSRKRGQPSNRRLTESLKLRVLTLIRENYSDFGPTLAAEKLRERHDIRLSIETVRNWMTSDGLWVPHARRKSRVYQPRHQRDCLGELIQIDGSHHDWFEGRVPKCCLLVFIDDATIPVILLCYKNSKEIIHLLTS